jgi:hypothetical protein
MTGIKLVHVPYRGTGPNLTDLLGGHIPMSFASHDGLILQRRLDSVNSNGALVLAFLDQGTNFI